MILNVLVDPIVVENGVFSWGGNQKEDVILRNINVRVKQASLVAVVGTVGSGKSSLLSAILGEMDKLSGRVNTKVRLHTHIFMNYFKQIT